MAEKRIVKLRKKKEKNGKVSLFLDKYIDGKREYEYLRMYLIGDKKDDDLTMKIAQRICDERNDLALKEEQRLFNNDVRLMTIHRFIDIFCKPMFHVLKYYINEKDKVAQINKQYERLFYEKIIETELSDSSIKQYITLFRAVRNKAIDMDAIDVYKSPSFKVKITSKEKQYLTIEELKQIANLELTGNKEIMRNAFCFSALTGLRISDLRTIKWENIREEDGYIRIVFRQTKTKSREYLDISDNAFRFLGERGEGLIFPNHLYSSWTYLNQIMEIAGIEKHISFHCARHTFAIMMLSMGVDIYTLSKLLGHSDISVTQVYARILDKGKRSAIDLIPKIL